MKGNEIAAILPPKHGKAREEAILDLVKRGNVVLRWTPISLYHEGKNTRSTSPPSHSCWARRGRTDFIQA